MTNLQPNLGYVWAFLRFAGYYNAAWGIFILSRPADFYGAFHRGALVPWYILPLGVVVLVLGGIYWWAGQRRDVRLGLWASVIGILTKTGGGFGGDWILFGGEGVSMTNFALHVGLNDRLWIPLFLLAAYTLWQHIAPKDA